MPAPVPYTGLNGMVAPAGTIGVPDDYQRIQADPSAFGAGIGQAEQKLGGATEQAGDTAIGIATTWQDLHNKTVADDMGNQLNAQWRTILSGDPNNPQDKGFLGLQEPTPCRRAPARCRRCRRPTIRRHRR